MNPSETVWLERFRKTHDLVLQQNGAEYVVHETTGLLELILTWQQKRDLAREMERDFFEGYRKKITRMSEELAEKYRENTSGVSFVALLDQRAKSHVTGNANKIQPIDMSKIKPGMEPWSNVWCNSKWQLFGSTTQQEREFSARTKELQKVLGADFPSWREIGMIWHGLDSMSRKTKAVVMVIGKKGEGNEDFSKPWTLIIKADGTKIFLPGIILVQDVAVHRSGRVVVRFSVNPIDDRWDNFRYCLQTKESEYT